jgi:hypothetical protein
MKCMRAEVFPETAYPGNNGLPSRREHKDGEEASRQRSRQAQSVYWKRGEGHGQSGMSVRSAVAAL